MVVTTVIEIALCSLVLNAQHRRPGDDRPGGVLPSAVHRGRGVDRSPRGTSSSVAEHAQQQQRDQGRKSCNAQQATEHATPIGEVSGIIPQL